MNSDDALYFASMLKFGTPEAKHEIITQLFLDCDEEFVKLFIQKVGRSKFMSWMPLA